MCCIQNKVPLFSGNVSTCMMVDWCLALCTLGNFSNFLPAHPASFEHNFVSGMQSFYFSESQDATVLQTCHEK